MWIWEKVTKTSLIQRKSNLKVLNDVRESRKIFKALETKRMKLMERLLRHREFLTNIIEGTRGRGRQKSTILWISTIVCRSVSTVLRMERFWTGESG